GKSFFKVADTVIEANSPTVSGRFVRLLCRAKSLSEKGLLHIAYGGRKSISVQLMLHGARCGVPRLQVGGKGFQRALEVCAGFFDFIAAAPVRLQGQSCRVAPGCS